jgi:ABC-type polysaccharide/polyol phosphate export permease
MSPPSMPVEASVIGTLESSSKQPRRAQAVNDLIAGFRKSWLWAELAKQDIQLRYRGSMLGPFWLTISTAVMVGSMGFLYAKLFNSPASSYLPYLTVGLVVWQFVATLITEGCGTFNAVASIIHQVPLPYSVHVYRLVARNVLVLGHNVIIIPIIMWMFHVTPNWDVLWIPLAVLVLCVNGVWLAILFGMISARFRDVPPIVASFVQVVFFVTPVFWTPAALGKWASIGELNPIFAAIDVIRAPIMGQAVAPYSWAILLIITAVGCTVTFAMFARFRYRIPFWVS